MKEQIIQLRGSSCAKMTESLVTIYFSIYSYAIIHWWKNEQNRKGETQVERNEEGKEEEGKNKHAEFTCQREKIPGPLSHHRA